MVRKTLPCLIVVLAALTAVAAAADPPAATKVVNINTASAEQLQLLPRVGPALAKRIIDFREANGAFEKTDELVAVKGIGDKSLAALKPYLAVTGDTTLEKKVKLPRASRSANASS
jgi:comEA protein